MVFIPTSVCMYVYMYINKQVCFHVKEAYALYELFHTRYSLFKQVYSHRVVKSIEYMICDVLLLADPVMKISASIHTAQDYLKLTVSITSMLQQLLHCI